MCKNALHIWVRTVGHYEDNTVFMESTHSIRPLCSNRWITVFERKSLDKSADTAFQWRFQIVCVLDSYRVQYVPFPQATDYPRYTPSSCSAVATRAVFIRWRLPIGIPKISNFKFQNSKFNSIFVKIRFNFSPFSSPHNKKRIRQKSKSGKIRSGRKSPIVQFPPRGLNFRILTFFNSQPLLEGQIKSTILKDKWQLPIVVLNIPINYRP